MYLAGRTLFFNINLRIRQWYTSSPLYAPGTTQSVGMVCACLFRVTALLILLLSDTDQNDLLLFSHRNCFFTLNAKNKFIDQVNYSFGGGAMTCYQSKMQLPFQVGSPAANITSL